MENANHNNGMIFIISGPSGVGKDTVVSAVKSHHGAKKLNFVTPMTYTTRERRPGDDDTTYIHISRRQFENIMFSEMVEHEENYGNLYGMSRASLEECLESGGNVLKIMDGKGAKHFKDIYPKETILIYLKAPSAKVLADRIQGRGSETSEQFARRMADNMEEMKNVSGFDYVVTSNVVDVAAEIIYTIIDECVKHRTEL